MHFELLAVKSTHHFLLKIMLLHRRLLKYLHLNLLLCSALSLSLLFPFSLSIQSVYLSFSAYIYVYKCAIEVLCLPKRKHFHLWVKTNASVRCNVSMRNHHHINILTDVDIVDTFRIRSLWWTMKLDEVLNKCVFVCLWALLTICPKSHK